MFNSQYFSDLWNDKTKRKRLIIIIVSIILLAIIIFGGYKGYNSFKSYLDKQEKQKEKEIEEIQKQFEAEKEVLLIELDSIKQIKTVIIKDYWDEFIKEKQRADKLQNAINNIRYNVYTRKQLDSIAQSVNYDKS